MKITARYKLVWIEINCVFIVVTSDGEVNGIRFFGSGKFH